MLLVRRAQTAPIHCTVQLQLCAFKTYSVFRYLDHNFDIHNETFKYKEFSITLMLPTIQEMMRWIFPVYLNINDATHEMAAGKILQSLNKHSSIAAGGRDGGMYLLFGRFGL